MGQDPPRAPATFPAADLGQRQTQRTGRHVAQGSRRPSRADNRGELRPNTRHGGVSAATAGKVKIEADDVARPVPLDQTRWAVDLVNGFVAVIEQLLATEPPS